MCPSVCVCECPGVYPVQLCPQEASVWQHRGCAIPGEWRFLRAQGHTCMRSRPRIALGCMAQTAGVPLQDVPQTGLPQTRVLPLGARITATTCGYLRAREGLGHQGYLG